MVNEAFSTLFLVEEIRRKAEDSLNVGGAAFSSIKQLSDKIEGNLSLGRLPLETKEEATSSWECCLFLNHFEFKSPENLWGQPQFGNVAFSN